MSTLPAQLFGYSVRPFVEETDLPLVQEWHRAHTGSDFPGALMSPIGVVAVDPYGKECAVLWLHLSLGCGVCWLEQPTARPGMMVSETIPAFKLLVATLEEVALAHNYKLMLAYPREPLDTAMEKWFGFTPSADVDPARLMLKYI